MAELLALVMSWSTTISLLVIVVHMTRSQRRCYDYAAERADFTEAGRAYSDMATVIVLDGKVDR